nr:MAG TPA: hypothetical protein [Caudoviricetes sp.]
MMAKRMIITHAPEPPKQPPSRFPSIAPTSAREKLESIALILSKYLQSALATRAMHQNRLRKDWKPSASMPYSCNTSFSGLLAFLSQKAANCGLVFARTCATCAGSLPEISFLICPTVDMARAMSRMPFRLFPALNSGFMFRLLSLAQRGRKPLAEDALQLIPGDKLRRPGRVLRVGIKAFKPIIIRGCHAQAVRRFHGKLRLILGHDPGLSAGRDGDICRIPDAGDKHPIRPALTRLLLPGGIGLPKAGRLRIAVAVRIMKHKRFLLIFSAFSLPFSCILKQQQSGYPSAIFWI